jgi:lipid-binding SYLF domain-containing protein
MNRPFFQRLLLCGAALFAFLPQAFAQSADESREDARLITSTQVLEELRATPDQNVPDWLMQRAYGVAVIPEVIKGAFIFGGRYGNGVLTVRDASGRFSNPIFITLSGGSVGWQVGATSTDVVLVFVTQRSVENFARGKFTLGADASVAAGPVGRQTEAAAGINAEIYSYSRSRGLFAGVALDGTVIAFDHHANNAFYHGDEVTTTEITTGKVVTHAETARRFLASVAESTNGSATDAAAASGSAPGAAPPPPAPVAPASGPPPSSGAVHTYPMEDAQPGSEPK